MSDESGRRDWYSEDWYLIVIDTSYTLEDILSREMIHSVTCRDLDGAFRHVWTINPIAPAAFSPGHTLPTREVIRRLGLNHTFVEGTLGIWPGLSKWPATRAVNLLAAQARLLTRVVRQARSRKNLVVRGGDPLYSGLFALMVARLSRKPLVIRIGGNNEQVFLDTGSPLMPRLFRKRPIERLVERLVLRSADSIIGANDDNLEWAISCGATASRSVTVRYGNIIDPVHFTAPNERPAPTALFQNLGINSQSPIISYIGRLERVKRVHSLIDVAFRLQEAGDEFVMVLVGEGSERQALEERVRHLGLTSNVKLAGALGQQDIANLLARSQIVLSPHTGRALGEAALAACPIVAFDIDWQGEIITDRVTGILLANEDAGAMTDATLRLLTNRRWATQLGAAARARALDILDPSLQTTNELEAYRFAIEAARGKGVACC